MERKHKDKHRKNAGNVAGLGLLRFLLTIFVLSLVFFSLHRFILVFLHRDQLDKAHLRLLWYCFFNRGLLFDTVTTTYLMILPAVILIITFLTGRTGYFIRKLVVVLLSADFIFGLAVSIADIPYFAFYNARVNRVILSWTDDLPLMLSAMVRNVYYIPFLLLFGVLVYFIIRGLNRFSYRMMTDPAHNRPVPWWGRILLSLPALSGLFLGLRGDVDPAGMPIQVKHAFETESPFLNQMGINPVFNFLHTFTEFDLNYLPDNEVVGNVQRYLGIKPEFESPIARRVTFNQPPKKYNIVLVLMESMYSGQMERFGNTLGLSPVLDSLAREGLCFDNVYTAGIHTYNGVFSTLFSLPALMQNKPTLSSESSGQLYAGLPNVLKKEGYKSVFFVTGSRDFDNFSGVFPPNGIDMMVDEERYPKKAALNNWGVGDHTMFDYSLPVVDSLAGLGSPFFALYMTVSTHSPYSVPKDIPFVPAAESARDRSYQYADWSIGRFLKMVKNKPWFSNTLFVFLADHGQVFDPVYDLDLSYHQTPLIFYAPSIITQPLSYKKVALQIDVFPTIMHFLSIPYINNTLGIDLLKESRPFAYFSSDYKLGVVNDEFFLVIDKSGKEALYKYRQRSLVNHYDRQKSLVDSMKNYTYSMLQTTQYLLRKRLAHLP